MLSTAITAKFIDVGFVVLKYCSHHIHLNQFASNIGAHEQHINSKTTAKCKNRNEKFLPFLKINPLAEARVNIYNHQFNKNVLNLGELQHR